MLLLNIFGYFILYSYYVILFIKYTVITQIVLLSIKYTVWELLKYIKLFLHVNVFYMYIYF